MAAKNIAIGVFLISFQYRMFSAFCFALRWLTLQRGGTAANQQPTLFFF